MTSRSTRKNTWKSDSIFYFSFPKLAFSPFPLRSVQRPRCWRRGSPTPFSCRSSSPCRRRPSLMDLFQPEYTRGKFLGLRCNWQLASNFAKLSMERKRDGSLINVWLLQKDFLLEKSGLRVPHIFHLTFCSRIDCTLFFCDSAFFYFMIVPYIQGPTCGLSTHPASLWKQRRSHTFLERFASQRPLLNRIGISFQRIWHTLCFE